MQYAQENGRLNLQDRERLAYIAGDTDTAALLAQLADDADEIQRLRLFYDAVCGQFPVHSKDSKASMLTALQHIWGAVADAGDIQAPD